MNDKGERKKRETRNQNTLRHGKVLFYVTAEGEVSEEGETENRQEVEEDKRGMRRREEMTVMRMVTTTSSRRSTLLFRSLLSLWLGLHCKLAGPGRVSGCHFLVGWFPLAFALFPGSSLSALSAPCFGLCCTLSCAR